mgnify:CR=1 FL=1|tara:strand:- start:55 stop:654 length:600 start_codon:yes stop_codon:yes gene_type:complete
MTIRVRKNTETRRQEIIQAVLDIIGQKGMHSLSTQNIADAVQLSTGALFRHFRNLEEMFDAVVIHSTQLLERNFPTNDLPPLERIFTLAENRIETLRTNPGLAWLLRSEQAYLCFPSAAVNELRQMVTHTKTFMFKALQEGIKKGEIRNDIKAELLMIPLMGGIHQLIDLVINQQANNKVDEKSVLKSLKKLIVAEHPK